MGKQTKRSRKFEAKGGVKTRLEKGTITNKGKLKRKRKSAGGGRGSNAVANKKAKELADEQIEKQRQKRKENDFVSTDNVGDLDIESFFSKVADEVEKMKTDPEEENDAINDEHPASAADGEGSSHSDSEESKDDGNGDDDSSDDEDVEEAASRMEKEMAKMKESDPDFHKFLSENDEDLLEFHAEEQDGDDGGEDDDDGDGDKKETKSNKKETPVIEVTPKFLASVEQGAFKSHGIKGLKRLINAYKAACHLSDQGSASNYRIEDSAVFDRLMVLALDRFHEELHYHLLGRGSGLRPDKNKAQNRESEDDEDEQGDGKPIPPKSLMRAPKWEQIRGLFQTFMKSTLHVMDSSKEPELLTFVLKSLANYIPYLTPIPHVAQFLLRSLSNLWSAPLDSSEDYQVVRLNAFIRIRQLALTQPFPFIEDCLKKPYLAYAKRAKFGGSSSITNVLPTLTFMGNCVVELYSLDYQSSYQHAFVYIRQLALHLRSAMQKKTPETFQQVYCWQYIHCLRLWVSVLVSACQQTDKHVRLDEVQQMRSLIFPLAQIILGVIRLVPTTRHLPLRLHCVRFLQKLAAASDTFIPTTSTLLETLDLKEVGLKPQRLKTRAKAIQLALVLKLPKDAALRTEEQLEACISELFTLLNREVDLYRYSPGFPEFTTLICQRLRKFCKECKNGRWRAYAKGSIDLCERYAEFATRGRIALKEAPRDIRKLEALKPPDTPNMYERHEAALAKERRLEQASRPAAKKNISKVAEQDAENQKQQEKGKVAKAEKKKKQKTKRAAPKEEAIPANALEQEDEVHEGIDWSDQEGDDSDEDDSEQH